MAGDAESNKGKGGLFASIGRLLGRRGGKGESDDTEAAPGEQTSAPEDRALASDPAAGAAGAGDSGRAAVGEDEEEELVLGPSFKASSPGEEESEEELTLTGDEPPREADAGGAREEAAGEPRHDESAESEADVILERLRAIRDEPEGEAPLTEERLTTSEEEWSASFGAAVPEDAEPHDAGATADDERDEAAPLFPGVEEEPADGSEPGASEEADMTTGRERGTEESDAGEARPEDAEPGKARTGEDEQTISATEEALEEAGEAQDKAAERPEAEVSTAEAPAVAEPEAEDGSAAEERKEPAEAAEPEEEEGPEGEDVAARTDAPPEAEVPAEAGMSPGEEAPAAEEAAGETEPAAIAAASGAPGESAESTRPDEAAAEGPLAAPAGLDEAGLEEIVRRVVREEMEGELGERLSANIRRMIRDEVQRAMIRHR